MKKLRNLCRKAKKYVSCCKDNSAVCAMAYGLYEMLLDARDAYRRVKRLWGAQYLGKYRSDAPSDDNIYYEKVLPKLPFRRLVSGRWLFKRHPRVIISFTSYPARFRAVPQCLKSIAYQTVRPDKIVLYLSREECGDKVPKELRWLKRYGLKIVLVEDNLKPHNKFFYSMQKYPNDIIITIDDDLLYESNTVETLLASYKKHPNCVSARRVHRIKKNKDGTLMPYNKWVNECKDVLKPNNTLFVTGMGGALYPPHCLPSDTFDVNAIKRLCPNADDVWLYFMELKAGVRGVWMPNKRPLPYLLHEFSDNGLWRNCNRQGGNDLYIRNVMEYLNISPSDITD